MEDNHIKLHHEFKNGNPGTLNIWHGTLPKIYDPEKVELEGIITAASEYFQKRKEVIDLATAHVVFDKEGKDITLTINETDKFATSVTGSLKRNKFLSSLHINSPVSYSIEDLQKTLRFAKKWFADQEKHKSLIFKLKNFTAEITTTTQRENDMAGNKLDLFQSKVSKFATVNDLGFVLKLPIFDGVDETTIPISAEIDVINSKVAIYLICDELEEKEDEIVEDIFKREKEIFKDIVIIEQ